MDRQPVTFCCDHCGIRDGEVAAPTRRLGESLEDWLGRLDHGVALAHLIRSPECRNTTVTLSFYAPKGGT